MNDKLKDLILGQIRRMVDLEYDGHYFPNLTHINDKLFKQYGKKSDELVTALLEYVTNTEDYQFFIKSFIRDLMFNSKMIGNKSNFFIMVNFILEDKLDMAGLTISSVFDLIRITGSKNLLFKSLDYVTMDSVFMRTIRLENKKFISDPDVINLEIQLFNKIVKKYKNEKDFLINFLYNIGEVFDLIPEPLKKEIEKFVNSLSFEDQTTIKHQGINLPNEYLNKLKISDDYMIIGTPDSATGLTAIKGKNNLYGYINRDSKIVIPTNFDEISSVNKKGLITGKVRKKIDNLESGYYKMDQFGTVVEFTPYRF